MSKPWNRRIDPDDPWLRHDDIVEHSPRTVEITKHGDYEGYDGQKNKKVNKFGIEFKGSELVLGLNKTNGYIIRTITGKVDPDEWIGQKITIRTAQLKKDDEPCIRIHMPSGSKIPGKYPKFKYTDEMEKK